MRDREGLDGDEPRGDGVFPGCLNAVESKAGKGVFEPDASDGVCSVEDLGSGAGLSSS